MKSHALACAESPPPGTSAQAPFPPTPPSLVQSEIHPRALASAEVEAPIAVPLLFGGLSAQPRVHAGHAHAL